jgi:hypothetical protein
MTVATALGWLSGLRLVAPGLDEATVVGTGIALHICYAVMCRLVAHNNGHKTNRWTVLGLIGGLWAVAVLILLPRRDAAPRPPGRPFP